MSRGRRSLDALAAVVALVLSATLLPGAAAAAGPTREYVVTLDVAGADARLVPSGRSARQRIRGRARRVATATDRLAHQNGLRPRYRFERAVSGFSARMTPAQAARIARDGSVANVRPVRRFKPASQVVPAGVRRVKAGPGGSPAPDVDVDIAILDTGVGPVGGDELNIAGGINCAQPSDAPGYDADDWGDSNFVRHGTHVAGTAAARDNGIGVVGVAPGARVWSARVFEGDFGSEATVVCGLLWAISTHDGPDAPPGTQPIEVINMSLQGPRPTIVESCPGALGDIMHAAICAAVDVGITVVVAAGNDSRNARFTSPAGYDQVITVGALSDFDGNGYSQASAACPGYAGEPDDSYASYSNWGEDVDIIAPGTCVVSTNTGAAGATRTLSGTSMSSPHVAGAVARYLAAHPGTSPGQMGRIVRAGGRLDWKIKSDPAWSGVGDRDEPKRVLDMAALLGAEGLRVWLSHGERTIGGTHRSKKVRVDVQRLGAYAGDVTLGTSGLPASASATFDAPVLGGLTGLGTRLRLRLQAGGADGHHALAVVAEGPGGGPSGSRPLTLTVDRAGPVTRWLGAFVREGVQLPRSGATRVNVRWGVRDALSAVKSVRLQRKIGNHAWKGVGTTMGRSLPATLKPGQRNQFRTRARDILGNTRWSAPVSARLSVRDSRSALWTRPAAGHWVTKRAGGAYGGSMLAANRPAGSLRTVFRGRAFAIVAPVGPGRGMLRVRVDGGPWQQVSLRAAKAAHRRIVFADGVRNGRHVVRIERVKGSTAIDAVLILR